MLNEQIKDYSKSNMFVRLATSRSRIVTTFCCTTF